MDSFQSLLQCPQEALLLLVHHFADQFLLADELRKSGAHLFFQCRNEVIHEWLLQIEESEAIAHCAAQNPTDHVARTCIGRQLSVGNGKGNSANVVAHHTHGHIRIVVCAILYLRQVFHSPDERLENIRVVIRRFALKSHTKPFETHTRIHMLGGQFL